CVEEVGRPRHAGPRARAGGGRRPTEARAGLSDEELAGRVGVPVSVAPVLRGARDLAEARAYADQVLEPATAEVEAPETFARARELVEAGLVRRGALRELRTRH